MEQTGSIENESRSPPKSGSLSLQVRFTTKQAEYAIPDYPFSIESDVEGAELNQILNRVLVDDGIVDAGKTKKFDFLIGGEFLRGSLEELVLRHEALKSASAPGTPLPPAIPTIGTEEIIEVEYVESCPPPEPKDSLLHDDWVSCIDVQGKWILSGSYDHSIHIWTTKGKHKQIVPGHSGPIKGICWINGEAQNPTFASGSQDQTIRIWEWDQGQNLLTCKWICKGHERSVECLKVEPSSLEFLASGSWDGQLKIWSASPSIDKSDTKILEATAPGDEIDDKIKVRVPTMTLAGHKECISSVDWISKNEVITSSWDHTIKTWDLEIGGIKSELAGQKAFFDCAWSPLSGSLITGSADRHIRLYDPRSNEGAVVKSTFTSHSGWISSVSWSTVNEYLFISGSYDNLMKLWDTRSPRAPLFTMTGHSDQVLCTSWKNPNYMMSGGSDNTLRLFKFKSQTQSED